MSTTLSCPRCFTQRSSVRRMRTLSLGVDLATAAAAAGVCLALAGADSHRQDRQHRTELGNSWYRGAGPAGGQGSIRRRMRCTRCRREVDPDTGMVEILDHVAVDDGGTTNPFARHRANPWRCGPGHWRAVRPSGMPRRNGLSTLRSMTEFLRRTRRWPRSRKPIWASEGLASFRENGRGLAKFTGR
jgi:hypothetical protein